MTIPRSRREDRLSRGCLVFVVFWCALAFDGLFSGVIVSVVASCLWLGIVALGIWAGIESEGSARAFLLSRLADLAGRRFVERTPLGAQPAEIRVGVQLWGWRLVQRRIAAAGVESVTWGAGQASAMSGKDQDDWDVTLWFEPEGASRKVQRNPARDLVVIGPAGPQAQAESLARDLAVLLRGAGVELAREGEACFSRVRALTAGQEGAERARRGEGPPRADEAASLR